MSTIAILGSGIVGQTLAAGLREVGHAVTIGSRNGKAVEGWDGAVAVHINDLPAVAPFGVDGVAAKSKLTGPLAVGL